MLMPSQMPWEFCKVCGRRDGIFHTYVTEFRGDAFELTGKVIVRCVRCETSAQPEFDSIEEANKWWNEKNRKEAK